jgi:uncharacterized membrane protein YvbJ
LWYPFLIILHDGLIGDSMPFCAKCGAALPDGANFCSKCGATVHSGTVDIGNEITRAFNTAGRELEAAFKTAREEIEKAFTQTKDVFSERSGPFCVKCGKRNPESARFCFSCGREIPQTT